MLSKNAQEFKNYLISQNINLEFIEGENEKTSVEIRETLKCGAKLRILIIFDKEDSLVGVFGLDFIQGINPTRRNYMYETINDLNDKYTYYKYVLDKDSLMVQSYQLFDNNFNSNVIMKIIFGMINVVDTEYQNLMKIIWS